MGKPDIQFKALAEDIEPIALSIRAFARRVRGSNEKGIKGLDIVGSLARNGVSEPTFKKTQDEMQTLTRQEAKKLLTGCMKIADIIIRHMMDMPQWEERAKETGAEICYLVFECLRAYKSESSAGYLKLFFKKYAERYPKRYQEIRDEREMVSDISVDDLKDDETHPLDKNEASKYWHNYYAEEINDGLVELVKNAFSAAKTDSEKKYLKYFLTFPFLISPIGEIEDLEPYIDCEYIARHSTIDEGSKSLGSIEADLAAYLGIQPRALRDWRKKGLNLMLQAKRHGDK